MTRTAAAAKEEPMKTSCSRRSGVRQYKMQSGRMMAPRPVIISSIQKFNRPETIRGQVDDQCYVVVKSGVAGGKRKRLLCVNKVAKNFLICWGGRPHGIE